MRARACLALALACVACSAPGARRPLVEELQVTTPAAARARWPEAPEAVRIEHLGEIRDERSFDRRFALLRRLSDAITGRGGARFVRPAALCIVGSSLAVADPGSGVVHRLDLELRRWRVLGQGGDARLSSPVGIACLPDGRIVVADSALERMFAFGPDGESLGTFGPDSLARPTGLAVDAANARLWVAETRANRVRALDFDGREIASFGGAGSEAGTLNAPTALASDGEGGLWVTDALNFRVQRFDARGRVLASIGAASDEPGGFSRPRGVALDRRGRLFVVDALFDAVQIFDPAGDLLLVFGGRGEGAGQLWLPSDVALDGSGTVFVSDSYNRRIQIYAYHPPEEGPP